MWSACIILNTVCFIRYNNLKIWDSAVWNAKICQVLKSRYMFKTFDKMKSLITTSSSCVQGKFYSWQWIRSVFTTCIQHITGRSHVTALRFCTHALNTTRVLAACRTRKKDDIMATFQKWLMWFPRNAISPFVSF